MREFYSNQAQTFFPINKRDEKLNHVTIFPLTKKEYFIVQICLLSRLQGMSTEIRGKNQRFRNVRRQ